MDSASTLDPLVSSGHPLHTRTLIVDVLQEDEGQLRALGVILDLRKCGFVPTGGDLQTAGVIHHMKLDVLIDVRTREIRRFEPDQPVVAVEATEYSAGECCRDPAHRLREMVGERMDEGVAKRLSHLFGGALGCSHLLTLAQLVCSVVPRTLDLEAARVDSGDSDAREPGERVFKRTIVFDGSELQAPRSYDLALQLSDFHTTPRVRCSGILDRLHEQHEVRVHARVDASNMAITELAAGQRLRRSSDSERSEWRSLGEPLASLVGTPAIGGLGRRLLALLGERPELAPLIDTLLNLAPGLIQCLAAAATEMIERLQQGDGDLASSGPSAATLGGQPDSCYIWRSGSRMALQRTYPPGVNAGGKSEADEQSSSSG
jgi:hypothetical protein